MGFRLRLRPLQTAAPFKPKNKTFLIEKSPIQTLGAPAPPDGQSSDQKSRLPGPGHLRQSINSQVGQM